MATGIGGERKARLSREDWVDAALDAIAEHGLAAVAVEPLARRLGVTKGSFYSHFSNRDELVAAALERWEATHSAEGMDTFPGLDDPAERLRAVLQMATEFSQSGAASVHVSLLGELHDPRVRAAVSRVTDSRLAALAASYRRLGMSRERAEHRARLAYAAYVGLLQLAQEGPERRLAGGELEAFMSELQAALIEL